MYTLINVLIYLILLRLQDLIDKKRRPILVTVIIFLVVVALCLKLMYYTVMHVWSNVILTGKKLIRQEIITWNQEGCPKLSSGGDAETTSRGMEYMFI